MLKRFGEREFADLPIRAISAPIVRDISMFPMFPERLNVKMMRTGIGQDALKGTQWELSRTLISVPKTSNDISFGRRRVECISLFINRIPDDALVLNECALPHAAWLTARR
jgi:hypothetical protein